MPMTDVDALDDDGGDAGDSDLAFCGEVGNAEARGTNRSSAAMRSCNCSLDARKRFISADIIVVDDDLGD